MDFSGRIVAFFDGSDLKLVYVSEEVKNNLQVKNENGRQFRIPQKNVITVLNAVSYENFCDKYSSLSSSMSSMCDEVETELLWEMVVDDNRELKSSELADNYFGDQEGQSICAVFSAALKDSVHFKRKGLHFIPRSQDQVEEQLLIVKRKQQKEAFRAKVIPWFEEVLKSDNVVVPEEFKPTLNLLEVFLYNRKPNESSKLLAQVCGDASLKETCYDILLKCSILDEDADRFLVLAGIDEKFSNRVIEAAENLTKEYSSEDREDISNLLTFTIDDQETQDIDDALSLEKLDNGNKRVGIHIADVSAYVEEADCLDDEASKRVTSIYLPSRTVHMFPSAISQRLASLVAGDRRPAMSFFVDFNEAGELIDWQVKLTEVLVDHKLSYDKADELIHEDSELGNVLEELGSIANSLKETRIEKGAALFNRPELKIRIKDEEVSVKVLSRSSVSRDLVSEFMILANSTAALYCARNDVPIIYRIQDKPEGLPEMDPDVYDPIIFEQCIKCMKKARLSLHPQSHGGLGADFYTQLTSPIRRYTDLVIQRQISSHLKSQELAYEPEALMSVIAAAEAVSSDVKDVQRKSENYWLHVFIKENMLGQEYEATVINKSAGGYFVEISEIVTKTKLMTQEKLDSGEKITVRIDKVKVSKGFIQLALCKS